MYATNSRVIDDHEKATADTSAVDVMESETEQRSNRGVYCWTVLLQNISENVTQNKKYNIYIEQAGGKVQCQTLSEMQQTNTAAMENHWRCWMGDRNGIQHTKSAAATIFRKFVFVVPRLVWRREREREREFICHISETT